MLKGITPTKYTESAVVFMETTKLLTATVVFSGFRFQNPTSGRNKSYQIKYVDYFGFYLFIF